MCPSSKVKNDDVLVFVFFIKSVSKRSRRRLIDDTFYFKTRNLASLLGGLPLGIVKVSRDGDHRLGDRGAEIGFGIVLELAQHHG